MALDLSSYFRQFIEDISLGEPQVTRLDSAGATIAEYLVKTYGATCRVFMQGSYPNGTAVEPVEGGEYDLDMVCVCVPAGSSSDTALDQLESVFRADARFRDRVLRKKPCVRLEYAEDDVGKFHVDVVPVRLSGLLQPPLEAPRRNDGWHGTAPAEYTEWCRRRGASYARTVKAMKRWRDEQQTVRHAIKSIVLQVLVASYMPQEVDDGSRLAATFRALHESLKNLTSPPSIPNPVLPSENLAARWTAESFRSFVTELAEAVEWADKATTATDIVEAADAWREILGDEFPLVAPNQLGIRLSDFTHTQTPAAKGWTEALDARYAISVEATVQRGKRGQTRRPYPSNGQLVFAGHKLHFKARVVAPNHAEVWWQVANTGGHARDTNALRGEIFKGRDLRKRPISEDENWEDTAYTGSHLVRAMLVRSNAVVARSDWFCVNIYAKGSPFRA